MDERSVGPSWYCVRTVFRFERAPTATYEGLTLWWAIGFPAAVALAEAEAYEDADSLAGCAYVGLAQAHELSEAPGHGTEVFSLMRDSSMSADAYVSAFFDTGGERQGDVSGR